MDHTYSSTLNWQTLTNLIGMPDRLTATTGDVTRPDAPKSRIRYLRPERRASGKVSRMYANPAWLLMILQIWKLSPN